MPCTFIALICLNQGKMTLQFKIIEMASVSIFFSLFLSAVNSIWLDLT